MKSLFETLRYFNDYFETTRTKNGVPHLEQEGGSYFLTYRLVDSLPQELLKKLKAEKEEWLVAHPKPWDEEVEEEYHRLFSAKVERWLDSGMGVCRLRSKPAQEVVLGSFHFGNSEQYELHSFAILPNHVHLLLTPVHGWSLEKIVGSWKKFSARRINILDGRTGSFWAKSYFDRLIRDSGHLANVIR